MHVFKGYREKEKQVKKTIEEGMRKWNKSWKCGIKNDNGREEL